MSTSAWKATLATTLLLAAATGTASADEAAATGDRLTTNFGMRPSPTTVPGQETPTSMSEVEEYARRLKGRDPAAYAVVREPIEGLIRRQKVADWGLYGGAILGGAIASAGSQILESRGDKCDEMASDTVAEARAKADCHEDALKVGAPVIGTGIVVFVIGLTTYLAARPSKRQIRRVFGQGTSTADGGVSLSLQLESAGGGAKAGLRGVF